MCLDKKKRLPFLLSTLLLISCSDTPMTHFKLADKGVITSSISNNTHLAVIISANHDTALWDLTKKKYLYSLRHDNKKQANIIAASFNKKGTLLLTAERKNIILWNTKTGKAIVNYDLPSQVQAIALSKQGETALIGLLNATALLINLNTGAAISAYKQTETINSVALSQDGKYALTGSDDHFAVLWDIKKTKIIHKLRHQRRVNIVGFSPDSTFIITNSSSGKVNIWDLKTGKINYALTKSPTQLSTFKFSPNSKELAIGIFPNRLELWTIEKNKAFIKNAWNLPKPSEWRPSATIINSISFNQNSNTLTTLDSRGIASWWALKK